MTVRPKLADTSKTIRSDAQRPVVRSGRIVSHPQELYREACEDGDGTRYTVIVWRPYPGLSETAYTLDDGRPVKFVDDGTFEVVETGLSIFRCP